MNSSWLRKLVMRRMARAAHRATRASLRAEALEERATPAGIFAIGSEPGAPASVVVFDAATRQQRFVLAPYTGFSGGVNVAVGDINGDGTPDVITGPKAGGGPDVNVFSGADGTLLGAFTVGDESSRAGVSVAAADYDRDGLAEVVVGTVRNGQPLVQVLRFSDRAVLRGYTPFEGSSGVSVAAGDVTGDGVPDTVVGAGPLGGPRVVVFDGATDARVRDFFTFESTFTGGVQVSAGDLNGDGRADVVTAANFLGGPRVQAFSGADGSVLVNFFAYSDQLRAGVSAAPFDAEGNNTLELATQNGVGQPPEVRVFDPRTLAQFPAPFTGLPVGTPYDMAAPVPAVTSTAAEPTRTSPVPFTVTFNEAVNGFTAAGLSVTNGAVSNFVRVDPRTYTFDITPAAEGSVTVTVTAGSATDAAGNRNAASAPLTRTFDLTAPAVTADPQTTNDTTPTLTGTVSDPQATVSVTVGGQTFAAAVSGTTWTGTIPAPLAEGTYTIQVAATDRAGNTGTAANGLVIDTTAPTTTLTTTAPEPTNTSPIPFTVTFIEDVTGFAATDVTVANGTVVNFTQADARTYTFGVTPAGQGTVMVVVPAGSAADAAGNGNAASNAVPRTFDSAAPAVTASPLTTNDTTPTLTGTVSDSTATVTVTVAGQSVTATVSGTTWTATVPDPLADGPYDVQASAADAAGNTGTTTLEGGLVIDTTAPAVTISGPSTPLTTGGPVTYTVTYTDATAVVVALTAADVTLDRTGTADGTVSVSGTTVTIGGITGDGTLGISIAAGTATDAAGNAAPAAGPAATFAVDNTPPDTEITAGPAAQSNSTSATFEFTGDDPNATFEASLDGGAFAPATSPVNLSGLAEGPHTFVVRATDAAGNTDPTPATFTWTVDLTAPGAATIDSFTPDTGAAGDAITSATTLTLTGTAEPGSTVEVFRGATSAGTTTADAGGAWSLPVTVPADGAYTFTAVATDPAGNAGPASAALPVTVDATAPTVTLAAPAATADTTPDVTVTATDALSGVPDGTAVAIDVDLNNDGDFADAGEADYATGTLTGGTVTVTLPALAEGTYQVRARASDVATNEGTSATVQVVVDATDPTATVAATAPNGLITGTAADAAGGGQSGVTGVTLTIQDGTGNYFDPATGDFTSATPVDVPVTGTTNWSFQLPTGVAADGDTLTVVATARDAAGNTGSSAPATVAVSDTTDPTVAVAGTAPGGVVSGTAADAGGAVRSGVVGVQVSIFDPAANGGAGGYWNGTDFSSATEVLFNATDTSTGGDWSTWQYASGGAIPAGDYQVRAVAIDGAGNDGEITMTVTFS